MAPKYISAVRYTNVNGIVPAPSRVQDHEVGLLRGSSVSQTSLTNLLEMNISLKKSKITKIYYYTFIFTKKIKLISTLKFFFKNVI